ncbi:hypothetical protein Q3H58_004006 [Pseudomonas psychrotolerans]|uniref:Uncharacterized protein n=1 Tax=Pseudomonas oryzihabitans TaxID=47885 RepID=A0AAJ2BLS0_9PSED|nr:hypothetical protein [Pseudomonas psychrotolerans]MDR6357335.1 hypothetical protein [Pseudomonas psychrotolerans]
MESGMRPQCKATDVPGNNYLPNMGEIGSAADPISPGALGLVQGLVRPSD